MLQTQNVWNGSKPCNLRIMSHHVAAQSVIPTVTEVYSNSVTTVCLLTFCTKSCVQKQLVWSQSVPNFQFILSLPSFIPQVNMRNPWASSFDITKAWPTTQTSCTASIRGLRELCLTRTSSSTWTSMLTAGQPNWSYSSCSSVFFFFSGELSVLI